MRTLKVLAMALMAFGAMGTATANAAPDAPMVTAAAETVHIAPGDADASSFDTPSSSGPVPSSVTEASQIEWPVITGEDDVKKALAEQKAAVLTPPEPTLLVSVNLATQRMTVSENGVSKFTWMISSGRAGYNTPTGTFKPTWKSAMWYSRQYDMSPMPHSVFFSGGAAIHATYATHQLGTPASHGCVRLSPKNAKAFYGLVGKHGMDRTRISVHGKPKHGKWNVASPRINNLRRYAAAPYGYAPPGYYSQQYFYKPSSAPRAYYKPYQPKRAAKRYKPAPSYADNSGIGW